MPVRGADPAVRHPLHEVLGRHVDEDRPIDPPAGLREGGIERLGLDLCPREAVEDRAVLRIGLLEAIEEDADDRLVGDELAAAHEPVGLAAEGGALRDRRPEQVTGRQHGHAEMARQDRSLGPFPRAGRPKEDDHRHRTRRNIRSDADEVIE